MQLKLKSFKNRWFISYENPDVYCLIEQYVIQFQRAQTEITMVYGVACVIQFQPAQTEIPRVYG